MKYAKEVIELMSAYPGRDFRMVELVNSVTSGKHTRKQRSAARRGILRVIQQLKESGCVIVRPPGKARGGYAVYRWKAK